MFDRLAVGQGDGINNKLKIKRNWLGKITEVELVIKDRGEDNKHTLEFLETIASVFHNGDL